MWEIKQVWYIKCETCGSKLTPALGSQNFECKNRDCKNRNIIVSGMHPDTIKKLGFKLENDCYVHDNGRYY